MMTVSARLKCFNSLRDKTLSFITKIIDIAMSDVKKKDSAIFYGMYDGMYATKHGCFITSDYHLKKLLSISEPDNIFAY